MKKLSVFVACLLLVACVLAIPAMAAETGYTASPEQPAAPTNPAEPPVTVVPEVPVDLGNSSVEIDGQVIQGDKLAEAGYELVAQEASEEATAAEEEVKSKPVNELTFDDGGKELEKQVKENGLDLSKLGVAKTVDLIVRKTDDHSVTLESSKVKVSVPLPYASQVKLVLYKLPDGTWKVMKFEINLADKNANGGFAEDSITIEDGGTGVYVFLTDLETIDDITAGKYDRENLFN